MRRAVLFAVTVFALVIGGCKPKPGDHCEGQKRLCDGSSELVCDADTYRSFRCAGPKGCVMEGGAARCDVSGNAAGDACPFGDDQQKTCGADGKHELTCESGKLTARACDQCATSCVMNEPTEGGACDGTIEPVCAANHARITSCEGGAWHRLDCLGEKACGVGALGLTCDLTAVNAGSWCATEGQKTCTTGGKGTATCTAHTWTNETACAGDQRCHFEDTSFTCEHHRCLLVPASVACASPPPPEE